EVRDLVLVPTLGDRQHQELLAGVLHPPPSKLERQLQGVHGSVGDDIEIFGSKAQETVADATAYQVTTRRKSPEDYEDLQKLKLRSHSLPRPMGRNTLSLGWVCRG